MSLILLFLPRAIRGKQARYLRQFLLRNSDVARAFTVIELENSGLGLRLAAKLVKRTGGIAQVNSFLRGRLIYRTEWIPMIDKYGAVERSGDGKGQRYLGEKRARLRKEPGLAAEEAKIGLEDEDRTREY